MSISDVAKIFKTPLGRVVAGGIGVSLVGALLIQVGVSSVVDVLSRSASWFPFILLSELGILFCTMSALRRLYQEDRHHLSGQLLIRAGLVGYVVMGLVPAGRALAEATRAALLGRASSIPRAMVAAVRLQGVSLLANSAISILSCLATFHAVGPGYPTAFMLGNGVLTGSLGMGLLYSCGRSKVGSWLGRKFPRAKGLGEVLDHHLHEGALIPLDALGWEFSGRLIQVIQNSLLLAAVGGNWGLVSSLCSEGLHLVGASIGDLIPGQLGATEVIYRMSSHILMLRPADAVSIALLAHLAQLFWITLGILIPLFLGSSEPVTAEQTG